MLQINDPYKNIIYFYTALNIIANVYNRITNRNQPNSSRGRGRGRTAAGRLSAGALNSNYQRNNPSRYTANSKSSNNANKKYSQDGVS